MPDKLAYVVTKGAFEACTVTLAVEVAPRYGSRVANPLSRVHSAI